MAHYWGKIATGPYPVNITQDLRDYAEQKGVEEKQALDEGMKEMSDTFKEKGGEVYTEAK